MPRTTRSRLLRDYSMSRLLLFLIVGALLSGLAIGVVEFATRSQEDTFPGAPLWQYLVRGIVSPLTVVLVLWITRRDGLFLRRDIRQTPGYHATPTI